MSNSGVPPQGQGGNKLVVFLLIGGVVILIVAGFVLLRRGEPDKGPEPPPVVDTGIATPAPLVIEQPSRPLSPEPDAGSGDTETQEKKSGRRRVDKIGTIDAKEVNSFINARFGQVKACYERRLKTNTFLEGKLDLNIGVSSQGKVTSVGVNNDTIRDAQMLSCVKQVIQDWDFPKPTGGRVTIAKTFSFKKKKSN